MHAAISSATLPMPAHALAEELKAARKRVELEQIALDGMLLALKANGLPTNGLLITPYQMAWRAAKNAEAKLLIGAPKSASEPETAATEPAAQAAKHRACDERCVKAKTQQAGPLGISPPWAGPGSCASHGAAARLHPNGLRSLMRFAVSVYGAPMYGSLRSSRSTSAGPGNEGK